MDFFINYIINPWGSYEGFESAGTLICLYVCEHEPVTP